MNLLKKLFGIILIIILCLILVVCSPKTFNSTSGSGERMKIEYNIERLNKLQIDSICNEENISSNLKKDWIYLTFQDDETRKYVEKYMFIEKMDSLEIIYFIDKREYEIYNISKRITYN